ncbi:NUDIX hydrolase [Hoeflea sp. TYP-13]|uniref:NUDIX hydrolase n=1 Tax=Hoeflea sp. TYP-13 TaxID=3230023 RepID=UPI0034C6B03E
MAYPRIAVSCILKRDDRYLMVLRGSGRSIGDYAFPGGKVEAGEQLAEAALRELREETGIAGSNARLFRLYDLIARDPDGVVESHYVLAVHLVDAEDHQEAVAADDAAAVGWFTVEEIKGLKTPPSVLECIEYIEINGLVSELSVPSMQA